MLKFYESCGYETNLMIVCQTSYGKVIGGFTPLVFKSQDGDSYVPDPSQQTFIFSLTNTDKFTMKTTNNQAFGHIFIISVLCPCTTNLSKTYFNTHDK